MLSFAEMKSVIEQCSYKPKWTIALHGRPDILKMLTDNTKPLEENK